MLKAIAVRKEYPAPSGSLLILDGVDLEVERGQSIAIMGPSGSGKSSLLYLLGSLEKPTGGTVEIDGQDLSRLQGRQLAAFRNRKIGFVFQDHCLLPQCTVLENVLLPSLVAAADGAEARARRLLAEVGLASRLHHRPAELSGGEKQRAALARALILEPALLLCDEPTGNLDQKSAESVAELLMGLHRQKQTMLVAVTHSREFAGRFETRFELHDRRLIPQ